MSFGGNDSPPPVPHYPSPPPPPEWVDQIDKIHGTEYIQVTGPDGKKQRIQQRLPRTPEEQKIYDEFGLLMNNAIVEIKKLSDYDPTAVVDFAPFVDVMNNLNDQRKAQITELSRLPDFDKYLDDFKNKGREVLQNEFKKQENENQEYLNRRGYGDSTAAIEMRNSFGAAKADILNKFDMDANTRSQQERARDQALREQEYDLGEKTRRDQLQKAQAEYQLKLDQHNQLEAQRQQKLQNQFGLFQMGSAGRNEDWQKAAMSRAPALYNQYFQQNSMDSLNRYNSQINATNAQYQNQLSAYNSKRPDFGSTMLQLGGTALGAAFGGPVGAAMGGGAASTFGGATYYSSPFGPRQVGVAYSGGNR